MTPEETIAAAELGTLPACTPGDEEWHRRRAVFLADDRPTTWWWLSFVDTTLPYREEDDYPGGPRWLGVCIVPAANIVQAAAVAHVVACNPGGQVSGYPFKLADGWTLNPEYVGRLFAGDEGRAFAERDLEELVMEVEP